MLQDGAQAWFVKTNRADRVDMFAAEHEGLLAIRASASIRCPSPLCFGQTEALSYLVLEYVPLSRSGDATLAGRQLAQMHRHSAPAFGWHRDNTIGSTPQINTWHQDWPGFWIQCRLGYQLRLAQPYGKHLRDLGERLMELLPRFLDHSPAPSLLHGDLWGGNLAYDAQGLPVIFDPATYYGDREADLAMTELFGGFSADFYAAYRESWPLDAGYATRKWLYNLYHILNHLNLFGDGYLGQAQSMMERLLAEAK